MRTRLACLVFLTVLPMAGCTPPTATSPAWRTTPSGLGIRDLSAGQGPFPMPGQTCVVEAQGWVEDGGAKGRLILDTRKRGFPASFPLGGGRVIKGWEEGLATLQKGGRRLIRVPPALGYTRAEAGADIPPGATLIFELELVDLR